MMRKIFKVFKWVIGVILLVAIITYAGLYFWANSFSVDSVNLSDYKWSEKMSTGEITEAAEVLISQMTLDEKIDQLVGDKKAMQKLVLPMFMLGRLGKIQSGYNERLEIPPFVFSDGPRGITVAKKGTCFPVAMARGASWDRDLEFRVGNAIGIEARASGVNYFGGLCINLLRHPSWGRAQETFSEDPYLLGEMGLSLMNGVQSHNVMVCAKHYALNNIENNRFYVNVETDERTLREVYLPHFKKVVDNGVASIMSAYNDFRGELCGHNDYLLDQVLRQEWGFKGFVTSDWMWGLEDTKEGILAGMDVEMPMPKYYTKSKISSLIESKDINENDIDKMTLRIITTKLKYMTTPDPMEYNEQLIASVEHRNLAKEAAEKSMVLLKNKGNILPLNKDKIKRIAIIGDLADVPSIGDHGSSRVNPDYVITPLEGLKKYLGKSVEILYCCGKNKEKTLQIAKEADVVLVIAGFKHSDEGEYIVISSDMEYVSKHRTREQEEERKKNKKWYERFIGGDRLNLSLKAQDIELINTVAKLNPNTVVSIIAGSAVTMEEWKENVAGILYMWYPGMEGGTALPNVLFGEVNPSGKLPFTIPKTMDQLPFFDVFTEEIEYGYYHGYTLLDKEEEEEEAAFPFGFGLSYTTFNYSNLEIENTELTENQSLKLKIKMSNSGAVAGNEVTQLYIGFKNSALDRPVKLLRQFDKNYVDAGDIIEIEFTVPWQGLAYYNPDSKTWEVEKMEYEVYVGGSSREEDLLKGVFLVE